MPWEHYCAPMQHRDNSIVYLWQIFQMGWKNASIQPDSIIKLLFHLPLHDQSWKSQGRHDEASKSDSKHICKLTTEITSATVKATNEG